MGGWHVIIVKHSVEAWAFCETCGWAGDLQGRGDRSAEVLDRMLVRMTAHRSAFNADHDMKVELVKRTYDKFNITDQVFWMARTAVVGSESGLTWHRPVGIYGMEI